MVVPPLVQPTSLVLPAGVCTVTLKFPGPEIMDEVTVPVSLVLLVTVVATATPLKTITEEETNWLPVAVTMKLADNCEKASVVGEIEVSIGAGRALPHSGFRALHPDRSASRAVRVRTISAVTIGADMKRPIP
jgi:hypothetical protein